MLSSLASDRRDLAILSVGPAQAATYRSTHYSPVIRLKAPSEMKVGHTYSFTGTRRPKFVSKRLVRAEQLPESQTIMGQLFEHDAEDKYYFQTTSGTVAYSGDEIAAVTATPLLANTKSEIRLGSFCRLLSSDHKHSYEGYLQGFDIENNPVLSINGTQTVFDAHKIDIDQIQDTRAPKASRP